MYCIFDILHIAGLVVDYGISNTILLEIPQFTTKQAIYAYTVHGSQHVHD